MFQGLSTALTALYANQQALDTTGNNIANVNTEGYSRQTVVMQPNGGLLNAFWSTGSKVGTGVDVTNIMRLRDDFLDSRSITEHGTQGNLTALKNTYDTLELTFKEPSDTGLQEQLADFWNAWDDAVSGNGDGASRINIIEQAKTLATGIQQAASDLDELSDTSTTDLQNSVTQLNAYARSIADLNQAIQSSYQAGQTPNNLLDQRDLLVSKMSDLAGVTTKKLDNGSIDVSVGGISIVRDSIVRPMQVDTSSGTPVLRWDADGNEATTTDGIVARVSSGKVAGLFTSITETIPKYQSLLDDFAANLVATVNAQHALGVDKSGNPGGVFFTGTTAATLNVDTTLAADPSLIAIGALGGGSSDIENARAMANLANSASGPDTTYRKLINTLGTESQRATTQSGIQDTIVHTVDNQRDSVSGVSLDEEMANMIKYQKAYSASAKYLSVMNDVLDSLIGLVR